MLVEDVPLLDLATGMRGVFVIADRQDGLLQLEIQWVKAYS